LINHFEEHVDRFDITRVVGAEVDCQTNTGVPGVFAAGDVTNVRDKQVIIAAGEGAKAALRVHEYLLTSH
jgi:alkyl hydroperoxide reductase subunit AhpF